jgi:predicted dehydrogenase
MYLPYEWRRWFPFGDGTIGDWTCHIVDPVFWAFDLGGPTTVQAQVKGFDPKTQGDTFPRGAVVTYEFAAKGSRGPITMKWFYGSEKPPRPKDLEEGRKFNEGGIVYGDKGTITYGPWGAGDCRIIPEEKMKAYKRPAATLPRIRGGHYLNFLQAIRGVTPASSDFSYGGPLTEIAMLGNIALRVDGLKLQWDAAAAKFTNSAEATALLTPTFRAPWTL